MTPADFISSVFLMAGAFLAGLVVSEIVWRRRYKGDCKCDLQSGACAHCDGVA